MGLDCDIMSVYDTNGGEEGIGGKYGGGEPAVAGEKGSVWGF